MSRVRRCSDGAGEEDLQTEIRADVRACERELGWRVQKFRREGADAVLDGCDGVGVDVVQTGVGCVGACGWTRGWTAVEFAWF